MKKRTKPFTFIKISPVTKIELLYIFKYNKSTIAIANDLKIYRPSISNKNVTSHQTVWKK